VSTLVEVEERLLWWMWQTRRFNGLGARAVGVDVIFPGWLNTGAGPDFRDAVIADASGHIRRGDVEIHVRESDWFGHGHDSDPNYDGVILHVVFARGERRAQTNNGEQPGVLDLSTVMVAPLDDLIQAHAGWGSDGLDCPIHPLGRQRALDAIVSRGTERFHAKVQRVAGDVDAIGDGEALYRLMSEALGYSRNREQFRRLAEQLPLDLIANLQPLEAEQLVLAAAGLIDHPILTRYLDGPVLKSGEIQTFRVRPSNHPAARLRGLIRIVHRHRHGLAESIRAATPETVWELFYVETEVPLVGQGRARDIALNVALPYLVVTGSVDPQQMLKGLKPPESNQWIRGLRRKLEAEGLKIRPYRAIHHLGLLDLAVSVCRYQHCEVCPLHDSATLQNAG
jgi:hypothetical protein